MLLRPSCLRRLASRSSSGRSTLGELVSGGLNFEVKRLLAINTILDARHARLLALKPIMRLPPIVLTSPPHPTLPSHAHTTSHVNRIVHGSQRRPSFPQALRQATLSSPSDPLVCPEGPGPGD